MTAFDRWLTTQPDEADIDELDPIHDACGLPCSDHVTVQRTDDDGNDYETQACPVEDEAALWLRYCVEAGNAANGSAEDGPGDMSDWPTFEEWKAEERDTDVVILTMPATLEVHIDLITGKPVASLCWTPNVGNGQLHTVAEADCLSSRRAHKAFVIAETTEWPNPELRA